jgi:leucyl/phenylalanyl-tRNA--protein transferase
VHFLSKFLYFPPVTEATVDGLLAVGGDLSVNRLLLAYSQGIFPWYDPDEPILWWAPPKRMVVHPQTYKVSKSMRNILNRKQFTVTRNTDFKGVIHNCQKVPRKDQTGTWISNEIIEAYTQLHQLGRVVSYEVWCNEELVGGLYGVDLGHVFCGESMFSLRPNASKVAFVHLIQDLKEKNYALLDCQVHNEHLEKLGAFEISREVFMQILQKGEPD